MNAPTKVAAETLSQAMALAFAEIEAATKAATNPAFKQGGKVSKYADLSAVIEAVKPALISHGLFFTQHCHPSEDGVIVETVLGHSGGEEKSLGKLFVPANKRDAHGFGSALTYCRRYALMTAFGVPAEDDDGNAAVKTSGNGDGEIIEREPVPGITKIKAALRGLKTAGDKIPVGDVGALEAFNALVSNAIEPLTKIKGANHGWWTGDGEDFEGFRSWIVRRRAELSEPDSEGFKMLIESMKTCDTKMALENWRSTNERFIEELGDADGRKFELAWNLHESAIQLQDTVGA